MKACWIIGIVMAAGMPARPQDCGVDVYVLTGAPRVSVPGVGLRTAAMFHQIGVNVRIRNGIPARAPSNTCGAPIVVQLENSAGYRGQADALAYAMPYKGSGTSIHVFIDRVLLHLNGELAFSNHLLAHVIVHEIAHVLEGLSRHSDEGVMKAVWSGQDYERMKHHPLPFAPEDARLIRQGLLKRTTRVVAE